MEVFTNILSELRAYGEGIVIAEQIPSKLTPDAIKNSGTKVVHRLVAQDDRELVGSAMNLAPEQIRGLARLAAGEAVAFTERLQKPVLLQMRGGVADAVAPVTDRELAEAMRGRGAAPPDRGGQRPRTEATDVAASFRRLVNSLRFAPAAALDHYEALVRALRLLNCQDGWDPAMAVAQLANEECESRGAFSGWSFDEVDRVVEAIIDDVRMVSQRRPPAGHLLTRSRHCTLARSLRSPDARSARGRVITGSTWTWRPIRRAARTFATHS